MCALSAEELLLACGSAGLLAVSLRTDLTVFAAKQPTAIREFVYGVAFDTNTDTLLLFFQTPTDVYQLVSLRRNASEWLEVQRLDTNPNPRSHYIPSISVCDSRVLLGQYGNPRTLHVFDVSEAHTLSDAGDVTPERRFYGFACARRGNDTLVAFAHSSSVSLQRLASLPLRLEPLASVDLTDPRRLLFRGDLLLVADWNEATRTHAIVSFRAADNALSERLVLLGAQTGIPRAWALAGERLVLANSKDLLEYGFT